MPRLRLVESPRDFANSIPTYLRPHSDGRAVYLDFHREAGSLGRAIGSTVTDVERAGFAVARVDMEAGLNPSP